MGNGNIRKLCFEFNAGILGLRAAHMNLCFHSSRRHENGMAYVLFVFGTDGIQQKETNTTKIGNQKWENIVAQIQVFLCVRRFCVSHLILFYSYILILFYFIRATRVPMNGCTSTGSSLKLNKCFSCNAAQRPDRNERTKDMGCHINT